VLDTVGAAGRAGETLSACAADEAGEAPKIIICIISVLYV
jgi:hypothetical protein